VSSGHLSGDEGEGTGCRRVAGRLRVARTLPFPAYTAPCENGLSGLDSALLYASEVTSVAGDGLQSSLVREGRNRLPVQRQARETGVGRLFVIGFDSRDRACPLVRVYAWTSALRSIRSLGGRERVGGGKEHSRDHASGTYGDQPDRPRGLLRNMSPRRPPHTDLPDEKQHRRPRGPTCSPPARA